MDGCVWSFFAIGALVFEYQRAIPRGEAFLVAGLLDQTCPNAVAIGGSKVKILYMVGSDSRYPSVCCGGFLSCTVASSMYWYCEIVCHWQESQVLVRTTPSTMDVSERQWKLG